MSEANKEYPRGYRFDSESMNILKEALSSINEISPKKITETRFIKALICLSQDINEEEILKAVEALEATKKMEREEHPRSYLFDSEIISTLKETLCKVNKISQKKVGEARLIKALIILSKHMDQKKIIKALKEVW